MSVCSFFLSTGHGMSLPALCKHTFSTLLIFFFFVATKQVTASPNCQPAICIALLYIYVYVSFHVFILSPNTRISFLLVLLFLKSYLKCVFCTHMRAWVCETVLQRWLAESNAGWVLIEAWNNIKPNPSFLCFCLLRSPWHSVTHGLPHLSYHLDAVSISFSLFVSLLSLPHVFSYHIFYLKKYIFHICITV